MIKLITNINLTKPYMTNDFKFKIIFNVQSLYNLCKFVLTNKDMTTNKKKLN